MSNTFLQKTIGNVDVSQIVESERNNRRTASDIKREMADIKEILTDVMVEGQHYGTIPGCGEKKCLLKPGAEKLSMTFRLRPIINNIGDVLTEHLKDNHINIQVFCHIVSHADVELATGIGSCSSMESKYRYRGGEKKGTGRQVPSQYWNLKKEGKAKEAHALLGGSGFSPGKINGEWQICETGEKVENPDIADTYNTVLKMAKKRAYVDGILSATCASDIFTQDAEDIQGDHVEDKTGKKEEPKAETKQPKQESPRITEGAEVITSIGAINKRTKKNSVTKKEFIVYEITGGNDVVYTASGDKAEDMMNVAKSAAGNGLKVKIKPKGDRYNTIIEIDIVEPDFSTKGLDEIPTDPIDDINHEEIPF